VQRVRRKIEQRKALYAQAEVRQTRTRRQTRKPDYVYSNDVDSEDDADEYTYQEEAHDEDEFDEDDFLNFGNESSNGSRKLRAVREGQRRSTRTTVMNANGKRESSTDSRDQWRGERRSSRLGAPIETQLDIEYPHKRARTEESTVSVNSAETPPTTTNGTANGLKIKVSGAAALKPTEIALESIAGKKRSKFWVYAVEPIPGAVPLPTNTAPESEIHGRASPGDKPNGNGNGNGNSTNHYTSTPEPSDYDMDNGRSHEVTLSPLDST